MRGKVKFYIFGNDVTGITPAYAGKSRMTARLTNQIWDHPRLCGEKPILQNRRYHHLGITPAYAGKRINRSGRI